MAVPTTLSGAEMTRGHRHARGVDESTPRVRAAVVVFDPALAASQPDRGARREHAERARPRRRGPVHGAGEPGRDARRPRGRAAARRGLVGRGAGPRALALGALLAGYVIDSTGLGLHHVLAQTLVRVAGAGHGPANAALLPHTIGALGRRAPEAIAALDGRGDGRRGERAAPRRERRRAAAARRAARRRRRARATTSPATRRAATIAATPAHRGGRALRLATSASTPPTSPPAPTRRRSARSSRTRRPRPTATRSSRSTKPRCSRTRVSSLSDSVHAWRLRPPRRHQPLRPQQHHDDEDHAVDAGGDRRQVEVEARRLLGRSNNTSGSR